METTTTQATTVKNVSPISPPLTAEQRVKNVSPETFFGMKSRNSLAASYDALEFLFILDTNAKNGYNTGVN